MGQRVRVELENHNAQNAVGPHNRRRKMETRHGRNTPHHKLGGAFAMHGLDIIVAVSQFDAKQTIGKVGIV